MSVTTGRLDAVCVVFEEHDSGGRVAKTAIDKRPVTGRVPVGPLGLRGDHVCDSRNHGGAHQAVYAYAEDEAQRWADELGRPVPAGWFGENLRVSGIATTDAVVGERWSIGDTLLEVSGPRAPCATFQRWVGRTQWVRRFTLRGDVGVYLRVLIEGTIGAGDRIDPVHVPSHGVTIRDVFTGANPELLQRLLVEEPSVSDKLAQWIQQRHLARATGQADGVDRAVRNP